MGEHMNEGKGYAHDDVQGRPFLWFGIGFAVFCVLSVVAVTFMYKGLSGYHDRNQAEVPTRVTTGPITPPGAQLQADPVADMKVMDKAQSDLLASYGWVDKANGVVHIPIERAMSLTLQRGLPAREGGSAAPDQIVQDSSAGRTSANR